MYENLIEPLKKNMELNSYLSLDKEKIEREYGKDVLDLIISLQNDFYKTNAAETEVVFSKRKEKAKNDFLKLHPNVCSEVLNIYLSDYLFNTR